MTLTPMGNAFAVMGHEIEREAILFLYGTSNDCFTPAENIHVWDLLYTMSKGDLKCSGRALGRVSARPERGQN